MQLRSYCDLLDVVIGLYTWRGANESIVLSLLCGSSSKRHLWRLRPQCGFLHMLMLVYLCRAQAADAAHACASSRPGAAASAQKRLPGASGAHSWPPHGLGLLQQLQAGAPALHDNLSADHFLAKLQLPCLVP